MTGSARRSIISAGAHHHRRLFRLRPRSRGEVVGCDFAGYPNIKRWLDNVKRLPSWPKVNEVLYGLVESVNGQSFVRV